jgi:hypothetical protein
MTSAHLLYIPIIFMLGLLTGMLANSQNKPERTTPFVRHSISSRLLIASLMVFLFAFIGTHFFPIPRSAHAVHHALHGAEIFDKKPSYTAKEVFDRISTFPSAGIALYKQFTYTTDILFPITLFAFLILLSLFVSERVGIRGKYQVLLAAVPAAWFGMDVLENAIVYRLLDSFPNRNEFLAGILGYITLTKFSLLLISISIPVIVKGFGNYLSRYFFSIKPSASQGAE